MNVTITRDASFTVRLTTWEIADLKAVAARRFVFSDPFEQKGQL